MASDAPVADLAAARREAEEALAKYDRLWGKGGHHPGEVIAGAIKSLRSLLAATAPAPPPSDAVREAAEDLLSDYVGVEDMLTAETAKKVHRLRAALDVQGGGR